MIHDTLDEQPFILLVSVSDLSEVGSPTHFCCVAQAWPSSGAGTLYSLAFHGGIGSILVLYTVFWLRLTLIETLLPLLVLSVFTFLSGYKALSHHAKTDLKKE